MPAFMKLGDIKGEATDQDHKDWVIIESLSAPIMRSIPEGAKDQQRARGETTLGDVIVVRLLDKSSVKLQEACANGTYFKEVDVHMCTTVKNKQEPYLKYKLKNAIISGYSCFAKTGPTLPSEEVSFSFTEVEWIYVLIDPKTGEKKGQVPAKYNPAEGRS